MGPFLHRLALAMGRTVPELLESLTSSELTDWIAYYNIDPFGEERADLRMGILASSLVNMQIAKGKKTKPKDFMPEFIRKAAKQTKDQMVAILSSFAQSQNAMVERKERGKHR